MFIHTRRGSTPLVAIIVALLGLGVWAATEAAGALDDRSTAQRLEREAEFLHAWGALTTAVESEYTAHSAALLDLVEGAEASAATEQRVAAVGETLAIFDDLAAGGETVGEVAGFMADEYRRAEADAPGSLDDYYEQTSAVLWAIERWGLEPELDVLLDVHVGAQIPRLVARDRLLISATERFDELSPEAQQWYAFGPADVELGLPPWIPDPDDPFGEAVDVSRRLEPTLPDLARQMADLATSPDFGILQRSDAMASVSKSSKPPRSSTCARHARTSKICARQAAGSQSTISDRVSHPSAISRRFPSMSSSSIER